MYTAFFVRAFCAAHRVWNDPGKCQNIHGHNYDVDIAVTIEGDLDEQGFVVGFDSIKQIVDVFDHTLILDESDPLYDAIEAIGLPITPVEGTPSTERLAALIAARTANTVMAERDGGITHVKVTVNLREGPGIKAQSVVHRAITTLGEPR